MLMRLIARVQGALTAVYRKGDEHLGWTFSACTKGMSHALGRRLRQGEIIEIELEMQEVAHDITINKIRNKNKLTIDADMRLDTGDRIDFRLNYAGKSPEFIGALDLVEQSFVEEVGDNDIRVEDATDEAVINMIDRLLKASQKVNDAVRAMIVEAKQ